jgi:S-adenosylmethionine synthetase
VSHVGKIYSVLTHLLANRIYQEIGGLEQVIVWLCSRIGAPINDPQAAAVQLTLKTGAQLADVTESVRQIVQRELENLANFCRRLAEGEYPVC